MTRLFISVSGDEVQDITRAGYDGEIVEHIPTRLRLYPDVRSGFYIEHEYSINDIFPMELRDDMPPIYRVEHQETLHRAPGSIWVCGWFTCGTGKVKISEIGIRHEALIIADSVDNFNATVQAFRNDELKMVESEKTLLEQLSAKNLALSLQAVQSRQRIQELEAEVKGKDGYIKVLREFITEITRRLIDKPVPDFPVQADRFAYFVSQAQRFKEIREKSMYKVLFGCR